MAEQKSNDTNARIAKLVTPRRDAEGNEQVWAELVVMKGETKNGGNFAMAEIHVPGGEDIKVSRLIVDRFEDGGFAINYPTGRKIEIDGKEVDERAPFITGRAVNREDADPKMSSVSLNLYSRSEGAAMLDELNAAGDDKEARTAVYQKYQTQLWGFADRRIEEQTNEFFRIKPSAAYLARRQEESKGAKADAPAAEAPAADEVPEEAKANKAPTQRAF